MKKKWIKDLNKNEVIHAPTQEIAEKLCKRFDELGLKWFNNSSYLSDNNWSLFKEDTCYCPKIGKYFTPGYYEILGCKIYTINDLKDFDEDKQNNHYENIINNTFRNIINCINNRINAFRKTGVE